MQQTQAITSRKLIGQHAPRVAQPAFLPAWTDDLHAFLGIQLVEGQHGNARLRRVDAGEVAKLLHGWQVGQLPRMVSKV